ncbi:GNAT family N-acetyltransferase [Paenibacillus hodogayensis]|uniref:GNAT family N-acetyltransferase n=1 Tax=Paenibacillus hodogayensis TaxID=279208 RepID=A0ABV5VRQ1_9BACL
MEHGANVVELLERDLMANVTLLKMMDMYQNKVESHIVRKNNHAGVLLLLPTEASVYDSHTYPETRYVVFLDYSDDAVLPLLLERLPAQTKVVLKLQRAGCAERLSGWMQLRHARTYWSYTCSPAAVYKSDAGVTANHELDEELVELWTGQGYGRKEIESYFKGGAVSYAIWERGAAVSACMAFPNYGRIWEVGAVHTVERRRGSGLAKRVVGTALHHLLRKGLTPRYQVAETNGASIRLAESLGLLPFVKLDHYVADTK